MLYNMILQLIMYRYNIYTMPDRKQSSWNKQTMFMWRVIKRSGAPNISFGDALKMASIIRSKLKDRDDCEAFKDGVEKKWENISKVLANGGMMSKKRKNVRGKGEDDSDYAGLRRRVAKKKRSVAKGEGEGGVLAGVLAGRKRVVRKRRVAKGDGEGVMAGRKRVVRKRVVRKRRVAKGDGEGGVLACRKSVTRKCRA